MLQAAGKTISIRSAFAIALGCTVTVAVYGYQFGRSNHCVYLLDALRLVDPALLAKDWFTNGTLQYHVLFSHFSALLMKLGIIEPVFAILYVLVAMLLHIAWRGIVELLGGDDGVYLLSVILYTLCAAGTGLGMYQFLQDSSLLPSNIANVAMLWGIWMWMSRRPVMAGTAIGVAGIFHLNHALVGSLLWLNLLAIDLKQLRQRQWMSATLLAILPSALNIGFAATQKLSRSGVMALDQFIELYVRLRHPHHYDPTSWPLGIWAAVLLPTFAGIALLRDRGRRVFLFMLILNLVALVGAGIWYWSETLVQMSLYRFSIYVQLLGCIAAAARIARSPYRQLCNGVMTSTVCGMLIVLGLLLGPYFGLFRISGDDAGYRALCRWVSQNTPVDAVLIVPPDEESMRLTGRRAVVVNFKAVPQLSAELNQWRTRLNDVLGITSLSNLPRGYERTRRAMRTRYDEQAFEDFELLAAKYGAEYVVTTRPLNAPAARLLYRDSASRYFLYAIGT